MKRILATIISMVMLVLAIPSMAWAQEQHGSNPYILNPERSIDNLEMLPAASAERPDEVTIFSTGVPKYFWINNFGGRSTDYLRWNVKSNLAETTDYYAWLHINAMAGTEFKITVSQGEQKTETNYTKAISGWEVAEFGIIKIPSGESTIELTKVTEAAQNCEIKGLDLIRESDREAYLNRIAQYRSSGEETKTRFSNQDYGLFFQYGVWGYPQEGPKKDMETATNDFDVDTFVALVKKVDAKFIIWSATWWEYKIQMPVDAVDTIMGNSDYTTERNLIGEIAEKCKEEGIDFYLYYHQGLQQEPAWKEKQNWPDEEFTLYGTGDRSVFFENWQKVVGEIGTTLGTNLDGWFFDDGCVYYPAPFESLANAAKAGNSERLISYNAWAGTKITEFQDMVFGEGTWGGSSDTTDGIFNSGKEKGLLQIGMPMLNNNNWGITSQNETIELVVQPDQMIQNVQSAHGRKVPMAMNIKMWEDGTIGQTTYDALVQLRDAMQGIETVQWINDDNENIQYSEGWNDLGEVYDGYYGKDCHNITLASAQNPSIQYTFTGTGIEVISKQAGWAANCEVYLDGEKVGKAEFNGTPEMNQKTGYTIQNLESGEHTIELKFISEGGAIEAQLDAFKVYNEQQETTDPVTKIEISSASAVMSSEGELQLNAVVKPQYATNKAVKWSVSDLNGNPTDLADITENGLLKGTGQGYGKVLVTAMAEENPDIKDTFEVSIEPLPERETVYGNDQRVELSDGWNISEPTKSINSVQANASAELKFEGNYVEWYGVKGSDHGRANIYIDGKYITNIDCYSAERAEDVLLFRSDDLGEGEHTIKIEVDSLKNDYASNNYIEIYKIICEKSPEKSVNREDLEKELEAGITILKDIEAGKYEDASAQVYVAAYDAAKTLSDEATQDEIDEAVKKLREARELLKEKEETEPDEGDKDPGDGDGNNKPGDGNQGSTKPDGNTASSGAPDKNQTGADKTDKNETYKAVQTGDSTGGLYVAAALVAVSGGVIIGKSRKQKKYHKN